jgi:amino acid transporter
VFIYWGWDSGVAVNEESEDSNEGPGRAAVMSTIVLVLIYVIVSAAGQAYGGIGLLTDEANQSDVLSVLGTEVFGSPWDKLLIVAVLTSASASTQTTILPTARTTLSMAHWKAIPKAFGQVHKRYLTPGFSTLLMGGASIAWTIVILNLSESALSDSITALGFPICFYYGFTGIACIVYYRHELRNSVRDFILLGVAPLLGSLILFGVFIKAMTFYGHEINVESKAILGITLPIWMGIGGLLIGVILMIVSRPFFKDFFSRKLETVQPGLFEQPVEHAPARF